MSEALTPAACQFCGRPDDLTMLAAKPCCLDCMVDVYAQTSAAFSEPAMAAYCRASGFAHLLPHL